MSIEQPAPSQALSAGASSSRRLLLFAQTDLWGMQEVSTVRRLGAFVALGVTLAVALLLAMGY